jgi:uncharacterized protein
MQGRFLNEQLSQLLKLFPAVVLVGARQVGKTTLVKQLANVINKPIIYIDLELPSDLAKLQDAELFLNAHTDKLVIIDEVQREKSIFPLLRALIDQNRTPARFILLGSASPELIRDSSETLAGRVAYIQLHPIFLNEYNSEGFKTLWERGGFPNSLFASSNTDSILWRQNFIKSYLERDLPLLGLKANPIMVRRLWEILAHQNGQLLNVSTLSIALGLKANLIKQYINFLEAAFLIYCIKPYLQNSRKRLIKAPKTFLIDTGILHSLLNIETMDNLLGHYVAGFSFENFVLQQLIANFGVENIFFYKTADGTEMDFVLAKSGKAFISIEVKLSSTPTTTKSFTTAIDDLQTQHNFIVAPVNMSYPIKQNVTVLAISEMLPTLTKIWFNNNLIDR